MHISSSLFDRNGHKLTHASKKPHGCQFCDKSYSDARSLKRHYENTHPDEYESCRILTRAAESGDCGETMAAAITKVSLQFSTSGLASGIQHSTIANQNSLAHQIAAALGPSQTNGVLKSELSSLIASRRFQLLVKIKP